MHRYRKGQTFRPPTAAESATQADALEAFRRQPAQPQDRRPVGQSIIVKTPEDGIPARDGTTIYSAICKKCVPIGAADEKEITETDQELNVFNPYLCAIAEGIYVITSLLGDGTRYVSGLVTACRRWGKLDEELVAGGTATVSLWWGSETHSWGEWDEDSDENWEVYAPPVMTAESTIVAGKWVQVGIVDGRKVALLHEC